MAKYKVFAAIDLGSTAIVMKIAQISKKNGIVPIDTIKYNLHIGSETYAVGKISYISVDKICTCLEEYMNIMKSYGADEYICYATTAIREAANSEYIIDQINIRTGLKVSIVSHEEECFLQKKALGLSTDYFNKAIDDGAVIIDVCSGSTQISHYENSNLTFSQKMPMGSIGVLEILSDVEDNTIAFAGILEEYIKISVEKYKNKFFINPKFSYLIILGSQISNLKILCSVQENKDLTINDLIKTYYILKNGSFDDLSRKYNIDYDDLNLLLPSILIYKSFIENNKNKIIKSPNVSFVDGILAEYSEKNNYISNESHDFTNDIISSAKYYARKYDIDEAHLDKIIEFAESVFQCIYKNFGLSKRDLLLLTVSAIFADTGLYININDYPKYSYDIVKSNHILGLSEKEKEIISFVVLFHNGMIPSDEYNVLSKSKKLLISKLASLLSLVNSLDIEYNQKIQRIGSSLKDSKLYITAYTDKDIVLENWRFNTSGKFFEEVFGIKAFLKRSNRV